MTLKGIKLFLLFITKVHQKRRDKSIQESLKESTSDEVKIKIRIPNSSSKNKSPKRMKENISSESIDSQKPIKKDLPEFDGGCWEMLNQDAVQILPPRPKIPTRPTTSCIKPTFKEKEKKGNR